MARTASTGLYYVTAKYGVSGGIKSVNEGAIATVACKSPTDHAVAGGVQTLGLGGKPAAVASSFPVGMDWDTNARSRTASTAGSSSSTLVRLPRRQTSG